MNEYSSAQIAEIVKRVIDSVEKEAAKSSSCNGGACGACTDCTVPVGVSNRHIHLSVSDVETLFGKGYNLTPMKDLSQPGQYACKETLTILGPSSSI